MGGRLTTIGSSSDTSRAHGMGLCQSRAMPA
jgi:hypothetical protein